MNKIINHNLESHGTIEKYFEKSSHKMRMMIVMGLLIEEARKSPGRKLKILSVGCSTGIFEEQFQRHLNVEIYGLDADRNALKQAKKKGVITHYGDLEKTYPFEDQTFDCVFGGEIVEHIFDVKKFLFECRRVLKDDGIIILTTPNLGRLTDRIRFLFGKAPKHTTPIHEYLHLHIRPFTADSFKKTLESQGFKFEKLSSTTVPLDPTFRWNFKSKFLARLFPTLGKTLIGQFRKVPDRPKFDSEKALQETEKWKTFYTHLSNLKKAKRTGWLKWGVPSSQTESVADHSISTAVLSWMMAERYYQKMDLNKLIRMAMIHDFAEAITGDLPSPEVKDLKEKYRNEELALKKIFSEFGNRQEILDLWKEYNQNQSPEAKLLKQVDKLEMVLQAREYEKTFNKNLQSFFDTSREKIYWPELKNVFTNLEKRPGRKISKP